MTSRGEYIIHGDDKVSCGECGAVVGRLVHSWLSLAGEEPRPTWSGYSYGSVMSGVPRIVGSTRDQSARALWSEHMMAHPVSSGQAQRPPEGA